MNKKQKTISKNFVSSIIIASIVILDQITKLFIRKYLEYGQSQNIIGIFSFTYLKNTGVSFGLFKGSNFLFTLISIIALIFFLYAFFKNKKYSLQFSFIISGIIGNTIDRILLGHVIDFIDFYYWPVFNISDSMISIGMIWILVLLIRNDEDII